MAGQTVFRIRELPLASVTAETMELFGICEGTHGGTSDGKRDETQSLIRLSMPECGLCELRWG